MIVSTEFIKGRDVLRDFCGYPILRKLFADGAIEAFGRRSIVAPDIEDQGVVCDSHLIQFINKSSRMVVGVLAGTSVTGLIDPTELLGDALNVIVSNG